MSGLYFRVGVFVNMSESVYVPAFVLECDMNMSTRRQKRNGEEVDDRLRML